MIELLIAAGLGALLYYHSQKKEVVVKTSTEVKERRVADDPIDIASYRASGQYLVNSGHPDELFREARQEMTLPEIKAKAAVKAKANDYLLKKYNFNTDGIVRRTQFGGPSGEVHYPLPEMGSGWYSKAAASHKPFITRIVPLNPY